MAPTSLFLLSNMYLAHNNHKEIARAMHGISRGIRLACDLLPSIKSFGNNWCMLQLQQWGLLSWLNAKVCRSPHRGTDQHDVKNTRTNKPTYNVWYEMYNTLLKHNNCGYTVLNTDLLHLIFYYAHNHEGKLINQTRAAHLSTQNQSI